MLRKVIQTLHTDVHEGRLYTHPLGSGQASVPCVLMEVEIGGVCQCRSRGSNVIRAVEEPTGWRCQRPALIGLDDS